MNLYVKEHKNKMKQYLLSLIHILEWFGKREDLKFLIYITDSLNFFLRKKYMFQKLNSFFRGKHWDNTLGKATDPSLKPVKLNAVKNHTNIKLIRKY